MPSELPPGRSLSLPTADPSPSESPTETECAVSKLIIKTMALSTPTLRWLRDCLNSILEDRPPEDEDPK